MKHETSQVALRWFTRLARRGMRHSNARDVMRRPRGASPAKMRAFARIDHGYRA